ncbi:MAG: 5-oxoprolinase subunit PxpA [Saprospiraceae bacterium]|jgi:UPF0271 protein|nr:5-oxoprolinase subunit PxpA [Saprospiraceae bacterium]
MKHKFPVLINCDVGESWFDRIVGNDEAIIPLSGAVNVACGGHGGDAMTIQNAVALAVKHNVLVGAHPSYPDRENFGRIYIPMERAVLQQSIEDQIRVVKDCIEAMGGSLYHVKAHGALYNRAAVDADEAETFVAAVRSVDSGLVIIAPDTSKMAEKGRAAGSKVMAEAFADRRYDKHGLLLPRGSTGAVIEDAAEAVEQLKSILAGVVVTAEKMTIPIKAETICVHGDHTHSVTILQAIHQFLQDAD